MATAGSPVRWTSEKATTEVTAMTRAVTRSRWAMKRSIGSQREPARPRLRAGAGHFQRAM